MGLLLCLLAAPTSAAPQAGVTLRAVEPIAVAAGDEAGPQSFALADLNKDGRPDLVVIAAADEQIHVRLGNGDGTFGGPTPYELDDVPVAVAVADLASPFASDEQGDIDGHADIVVAMDDGEAVIFLGRGDGSFDPPEQDLSDVLDAGELLGVVVADLDGNQRLDLVFLDAFDEVYFLCNLAGNLAACTTDYLETMGEEPVAIAGGDFDGDSAFDVAVLNTLSGDLSVMFGEGDGTFVEVTAPIDVSLGDQELLHLAAGRLDDGNTDDLLVGARSTGEPSQLTVLYGQSNRTFAKGASVGAPALSGMALGDLNQDGNVDVGLITEEAADLFIALGDGTGGFADPVAVSGFAPGLGRILLLTDVDGDAQPDVATLDLEGSELRIGLNETQAVCAGDCDLDGDISIDELVLAVGIALGNRPLSSCMAVDGNGDGRVAVNELVAAVNRALAGCSS